MVEEDLSIIDLEKQKTTPTHQQMKYIRAKVKKNLNNELKKLSSMHERSIRDICEKYNISFNTLTDEDNFKSAVTSLESANMRGDPEAHRRVDELRQAKKIIDEKMDRYNKSRDNIIKRYKKERDRVNEIDKRRTEKMRKKIELSMKMKRADADSVIKLEERINKLEQIKSELISTKEYRRKIAKLESRQAKQTRIIEELERDIYKIKEIIKVNRLDR